MEEVNAIVANPAETATVVCSGVHVFQANVGHTDETLTLQELVNELPDTIAKQNQPGTSHGCSGDRILDLLRRVHLDMDDLHRYAFIDYDRKYTRNLIATDNETYTLLLLCWSPGRASPIHDHPCDGCWMRVIHGQVCECRYKEVEQQEQQQSANKNSDSSSSRCCEARTTHGDDLPLECTHSETYQQGQVAFINDFLGYHKISNPSSELAVTLHLYCPPFDECRVWLDQNEHSCRTKVHYDSANGNLLLH
ncbi:hypothetical protein ACA910_008940 [Epithemia clementina (nom. ined.)]